MSYNSINMLRNVQLFSASTRLLRNFSSYHKDLIKSGITAASGGPTGTLMQDLKNANSPNTVLNIVGTHHKSMNSEHIIQALRSIFSIQKFGNSDMSTKQILGHPMFETLCRNLKVKAPTIEIADAIEALKVVSYVGVDSTSTIVQVLLQILRYNINDLSPQQIIFVDFLLSQFKSSPLADGLLIALPVVFDVQLTSKLDRSNVVQVAESLHYISKKPVSDKSVEFICETMLKCYNREVVPPKVAKSVIWSICDMDEDEFFKPLLEKSVEAVLIGVDTLDFNEIETTISKMTSKNLSKHRFYYNDRLMDMFAKMVITCDKGFDTAINVLRKFLKIGHANPHLIDYLTEKCVQNPDKLINSHAAVVYTYICGLTQTEHRPQYIDFIKDSIIETECFKTCSRDDIIWPKLLTSLSALGIYKQDVFERAKELQIMERIVKTRFYGDLEHFIVLYQAISIFQPKFLSYIPQDVVEGAVSRIRPVVEHPLENALKQAVGGSNYVATGVKTKLSHYIDHVVVMRRGGFPVALPQHITYLEEISNSIPEDSTTISVLALDRYHYTLNEILRGITALEIKTLEAKGYAVVPISIEAWQELQDYEKIPYLMRAVRLKADGCSQLADCVM